jgi:hypothetical protein
MEFYNIEEKGKSIGDVIEFESDEVVVYWNKSSSIEVFRNIEHLKKSLAKNLIIIYNRVKCIDDY